MRTNTLRIKTVNKAIREAGYPVTLIKGYGYFYFVTDEGHNDHFGPTSWREKAIYVNTLNSFTLEQWVAEAAPAKPTTGA